MERLATRCPHCQTSFRVTMAQLELREGKVRCGACREVFNGIDHVFEHAKDSDFTLTSPAPQDLSDRMTLIDFGSLRGTRAAPAESSMQDELDALSRAIADLQGKPWAEPPATPRSEFADDDDDDTGQAPAGESAEPGFVQQARRRKRNARLWKVLLWVGIPLLLLALFAQLAYHFRSEIAARSPLADRALRAACARLGCTIRLPMQLDQLSLASSHLEQAAPAALPADATAAPADAPHQLTLVALLRNRGDTVQAWPSLDLRLKNAEGTTVVRKALLPTQYLKPDEIQRGMAAHSEREIRIAFDLSGESPTDFDLALFYH